MRFPMIMTTYRSAHYIFRIVGGYNYSYDYDGKTWNGKIRLQADSDKKEGRFMIITLNTMITIEEICNGFGYNKIEVIGLFGLSGKLTIQPEYQRN